MLCTIELDSVLRDAAQRLLRERVRIATKALQRCNDGRVTKNWRPSELAVTKSHYIMELDTLGKLIAAFDNAANGRDIETRIADALATGERGDALIDVARNAHAAESAHASVNGLCERIAELDSDALAEIRNAVAKAEAKAISDNDSMEVHLAMKGSGLL